MEKDKEEGPICKTSDRAPPHAASRRIFVQIARSWGTTKILNPSVPDRLLLPESEIHLRCSLLQFLNEHIADFAWRWKERGAWDAFINIISRFPSAQKGPKVPRDGMDNWDLGEGENM